MRAAATTRPAVERRGVAVLARTDATTSPRTQGRVTPVARAPDTDWHVSRLYDFALELGASMLVPRYSRYVVDLNRPPDDTSLYPGQNTTGLCPVVQFSSEPVYRSGCEPDAEEITARVEQFWKPYHRALNEDRVAPLQQQLALLQREHRQLRGTLALITALFALSTTLAALLFWLR